MPASRLPAVLAIAALIVATATGCSTTSWLLPSLSSPPTADQVMQQLAAKVPSAKLGITYTAENDPNPWVPETSRTTADLPLRS